jgi:hypothetical protein
LCGLFSAGMRSGAGTALESPAPAALYELSSCQHLRSCSCNFCGRQVIHDARRKSKPGGKITTSNAARTVRCNPTRRSVAPDERSQTAQALKTCTLVFSWAEITKSFSGKGSPSSRISVKSVRRSGHGTVSTFISTTQSENILGIARLRLEKHTPKKLMVDLIPLQVRYDVLSNFDCSETHIPKDLTLPKHKSPTLRTPTGSVKVTFREPGSVPVGRQSGSRPAQRVSRHCQTGCLDLWPVTPRPNGIAGTGKTRAGTVRNWNAQ